jgi:hypothetical protein
VIAGLLALQAAGGKGAVTIDQPLWKFHRQGVQISLFNSMPGKTKQAPCPDR